MDAHDITNRFTYHAPTEAKVARHGAVRSKLEAAAHFVNESCPDGREKSLAITHLEEAMFWANAAIARVHAAQSIPDNQAGIPGV